jgi:hypothetical protein
VAWEWLGSGLCVFGVACEWLGSGLEVACGFLGWLGVGGFVFGLGVAWVSWVWLGCGLGVAWAWLECVKSWVRCLGCGLGVSWVWRVLAVACKRLVVAGGLWHRLVAETTVPLFVVSEKKCAQRQGG